MENADTAGRYLAERHQTAGVFDQANSVLNYAERPRQDDWSLRSSLVRFAQGHPVRAGAILEMTRRCDATLGPIANTLSAQCVQADRDVTLESLISGSADNATEPYPDARVVDIARVMRAVPQSSDAFLEAYSDEVAAAGTPLDPDELAALELIVVVLDLDDLADELSTWASGQTSEAPVALVDKVIPKVKADLDALGVPAESAPPGRQGPRRT